MYMHYMCGSRRTLGRYASPGTGHLMDFCFETGSLSIYIFLGSPDQPLFEQPVCFETGPLIALPRLTGQ